jgi:hypothetical protein
VAPVLFVIALRALGAAGAAMISRPARRGLTVRIGGSAVDDIRLTGAVGAGAELLCDGDGWTLRAGGRVRRASDGTSFVLGPWTIVVALGDDGPPLAGDAARLELDGEGDIALPGSEPALVGAADWCAVRIPRLAIPVAAVLRSDPSGATWLYPLDAVPLRRNGARVRAPVRLADGDTIRLGGETVRFADPREQLDRLLGAVRGEPPPRPRTPQATTTEVVLWTVGAAALVGYLSVAWIRW